MMTYSNLNAIPAPGLPTGPIQDGVQIRDGAPLSEFEFDAASLPVIGRDEARAVGVALSFADDEADACGEDRFELVLISADGRALMRLGPFGEEDVVAQWRDCAAKSGLPRMIVREDGSVAEVSRQIGPLALGRTRQRRRVGLLNGRRPRFLVRRKTARLPARPQIHRGESEIIARS